LGRNQQNEEVKVKREVGAPEGYDDRLQAIAVARLGKAEQAVVVQDPNTKKWHALETTAGFQPGPVSVNAPQRLAGVGMPSLAEMGQWRGKVKALNETLSRLETMKTQGVDASSIDPAIEQTRKDLKDAQLKLASATLGVPETEILINAKSSDRKAGKINITLEDNPKSVGRTGPVGGGKLEGFQPGQDSALEIDLADLIADPIGSQVTLFHEVSHLQHSELAQAWVKKYTDSGHILVTDPPQAFDYFRKWINNQPAKELSKADK